MALQTRVRLGAVVLAAVLMAACGSTVQDRVALQGGEGSGLAGSDGLGGVVGSDQPGSVGTNGGGTSGAPGVTSSGGGTGGPIAGVGTPGAIAPGGAGSTLSGPGVTDDKVYVGLIYDVNAGAVNEAAGIGAITSGDSKANTRAIIKDINAHGGVGGRELVPVYAEMDSTSTDTLDHQYAVTCEKFTQDNPRVFAVEGDGGAPYRQCISKAGVTILSAGLPTVGAADFARFPGFFEQGYPNVDRLAAYHVKPLVAQHYFTPWNTVTGKPAAAGAVKVGILTYNDQVFSNAVDRYLVPAVKRLGFQVQVAKIAPLSGASDIGAQGAAVKSAQLSFAANGVTHVIPFESNGGLSTFFLPTARSQGYYPRYGVFTASAPQALLEAGAADKSQMNGAVGYGWLPSIDMPASYNPADGPYSNANRRHCLAVMKANGISFTSGNAEGIALNSCATLYLLKAVLDKTPNQINMSTFIRGAESLGTSYQRAGGVGQDFRPGRHDAANKVYYWRFYADCGCFHYYGPTQTIP